MKFHTEPTGYRKTALSDLQGAWENLRHTVVEKGPFPESDKLLFHVDEGMSWESVRNLQYMKKCLLLVRNVLIQGEVPEEVVSCLDEVSGLMDETLQALKEGEIN